MMLKSLSLLTLLTSCLCLPLEDGQVQNPVQHEVEPFSQSDNQLLDQLQDLPQEIPKPEANQPDLQSPEKKPDADLNTESSHWHGHGYHGHGYGHGHHGYGHGHHGYGGYGRGYGGYGGYSHGYGGYGHGYGNGIGFGYPSHRRSFQQSYYPNDYYYRPRIDPYYYPQNYYIGGSIYW